MPTDPYVYPGTEVLRNRFDARHADELAEREAIITAARLRELAETPLDGNYDLDHLRAMHRHVFGDVYAWAGEIRTVEISKGDELFALPQHIESFLSGSLAQLQREDYLRPLGREAFLDRLSQVLGDINAAHPFREGNGRTQRAFIGQLAEQAGYHIAWDRLTQATNVDASRAAHHGDLRPLRAMLDDITVSRRRTVGRDIEDQRAGDQRDDDRSR